MRTERIDAMVGGADLGLDLAEELGRLAPFGMGNPGVRLLVPGASVRDVRPMGQEGKHSRFNLHCGAHRALGVAFGRSKLGVADEDPVDAAVRLEVNHWNGAVEPRVVLRELYPHEADEGGRTGPQRPRPMWWERFEAELAADPAAVAAPAIDGSTETGRRRGGEGRLRGFRLGRRDPDRARLERRLASSAWSPTCLAPGADGEDRRQARRVRGARTRPRPGRELRARRPRRPTRLRPQLELLAARSPADGKGYLHPAWGEPERRFALRAPRPAGAARGSGRDVPRPA